MFWEAWVPRRDLGGLVVCISLLTAESSLVFSTIWIVLRRVLARVEFLLEVRVWGGDGGVVLDRLDELDGDNGVDNGDGLRVGVCSDDGSIVEEAAEDNCFFEIIKRFPAIGFFMMAVETDVATLDICKGPSSSSSSNCSCCLC